MKTNSENRIIGVPKGSHDSFEKLMNNTVRILNDRASINPEHYRKKSPSDIEVCAWDAIRQACYGTPFNPEEIILVSGHKFPDIVAAGYYGVEVKCTISDSWTSTGSSIVETTREKEVEDLFLLFGKLGGRFPEFRCRPYQEVMYDIAVTHSPRYLINMELNESETIFHKMGTTYDDFRKDPDAISKVRKYYREKAAAQNKQEMPWWITSDNVGQTRSFNIRLWNSLEKEEKKDLQAKCMILFPEALNPNGGNTKYNNISLWLCSYKQVVFPNIRDIFSAGGKIVKADEVKLDYPAAHVFSIIVEYSAMIKQMLDSPSKELQLLIKDYNPTLLESSDLFEKWLETCDSFARRNNVPLREWIQAGPKFTYSINSSSHDLISPSFPDQ